MTTLSNCIGMCVLAGCMTGGDHRIAVEQRNDLGVTTIEASQFQDHGDKVFELRGFTDNDEAVAVIRLRTGVVGDLPQYVGGAGDFGSEITFTVAGHVTRMVTREREQFRLTSPDDAATTEFVQLRAVASALAHDANINVEVEPTSDAGGEQAFGYQTCPAGYLNTTPTAVQCCFSGEATFNYPWHTRFFNAAGALVTRSINANGNSPRVPGACKASDGVSSCSGSSCYYGPNAFNRPVVTTPPGGTPYGKTTLVFPFGPSYPVCSTSWYASPPTPIFGNVTGTFPTSQGCPGGFDGAGDWDY